VPTVSLPRLSLVLCVANLIDKTIQATLNWFHLQLAIFFKPNHLKFVFAVTVLMLMGIMYSYFVLIGPLL
jgi:hypothetical protein